MESSHMDWKFTDQTKNFNTFNTEFPIPPINYTQLDKPKVFKQK